MRFHAVKARAARCARYGTIGASSDTIEPLPKPLPKRAASRRRARLARLGGPPSASFSMRERALLLLTGFELLLRFFEQHPHQAFVVVNKCFAKIVDYVEVVISEIS